MIEEKGGLGFILDMAVNNIQKSTIDGRGRMDFIEWKRERGWSILLNPNLDCCRT